MCAFLIAGPDLIRLRQREISLAGTMKRTTTKIDMQDSMVWAVRGRGIECVRTSRHPESLGATSWCATVSGFLGSRKIHWTKRESISPRLDVTGLMGQGVSKQKGEGGGGQHRHGEMFQHPWHVDRILLVAL